jgi:hypothetical protein
LSDDLLVFRLTDEGQILWQMLTRQDRQGRGGEELEKPAS